MRSTRKKDKNEQIPAEKQEEQGGALPIGMCLGVAVGASTDAAEKKTPPEGEPAEDKDPKETL